MKKEDQSIVSIANSIVEQLRELAQSQREEIFSSIFENFCRDCGGAYRYKGDVCHCQNDE